jgi:hypothetical protein
MTNTVEKKKKEASIMGKENKKDSMDTVHKNKKNYLNFKENPAEIPILKIGSISHPTVKFSLLAGLYKIFF